MHGAFAGSKPEVCVHLAALAGVRPSLERPAAYMDVNVRGTACVLEAARAAGTRRFVLGSSSSVYGAHAQAPFGETARVDAPESPYAASKVAAEVLARTFHNLYGIEVAALRFFTVYGPRQRPDLAIHKFSRRMLAGQPLPFFGDGESRRDYTWVDDIVAGVVAACDVPLCSTSSTSAGRTPPRSPGWSRSSKRRWECGPSSTASRPSPGTFPSPARTCPTPERCSGTLRGRPSETAWASSLPGSEEKGATGPERVVIIRP